LKNSAAQDTDQLAIIQKNLNIQAAANLLKVRFLKQSIKNSNRYNKKTKR
jgi:hypothetical protein